jgi:hypothetical protein
LDYEKRGLFYNRLKTSSLSGCRIGPKAWEVILRRPRQGPLFGVMGGSDIWSSVLPI